MPDDSDLTFERVDPGDVQDGVPGDLPINPDVPPSDRPTNHDADADRGSAGGEDSREATVPAAAVRPLRARGRARVEYVRRVRGVLRTRWDILAVIAAGGAVGSLGRWALTLLLPHPAGTFPWATFTANVVGCLLLGFLMVFVIEVWPPSRLLRPFLGVGVLGGFTTFSTYMLDARALLVSGRTALAGEYVFGSLAAGLAGVWVGISAARLVVRLAERRFAARHDRRPLPRQPTRTSRTAGPTRTGSPASATRSRR